MDIDELYTRFIQSNGVTTDSRTPGKNTIFFALKGEKFNGNNFALQSLVNGCEYAVVDEQEFYDEGNDKLILVENSLATLQNLASLHRKKMNATIIGITGTNGKTTTKELIASVLSKRYNTIATQGNLNNHIGVPLTLLKIKEQDEFAIIEMGANHVGEIEILANITAPDYGIITNIGRAHLQGFGSFEGIITTKGELYNYIRLHNGTIFINADNDILKNISANISAIFYGINKEDENIGIKGRIASCDPFLCFEWCKNSDWHFVSSKLIGSYNIENMLAAATIGDYFGIAAEDICTALQEYTPNNNRSQFTETEHNKLIVDAYNANPTSMIAALENFIHIHSNLPKLLILGDMKELGNESQTEHQKIIEYINRNYESFEQVWLVGEEFSNTDNTFSCFKNRYEVVEKLSNKPLVDYLILIKGSNSMKLNEVINLL